MAGKKNKIITHKNIHVCCTQNSNRDLEIIRQGIQLISAILLRMWQERVPTHTLTGTQLIIRRINNKAASSFTDNCDNLRQTLQRREKYPLPLNRSLELEQLDKLMSHIAQQPKTLYWIKKSLKIAQIELHNRSKYLNWNKEEWKRWTKITNFLQTKVDEIDRKCQNFKRRIYYHKAKEQNGHIHCKNILVSKPTKSDRKSPKDIEKITNISNVRNATTTNQ
jgi:hypothetical protein